MSSLNSFHDFYYTPMMQLTVTTILSKLIAGNYGNTILLFEMIIVKLTTTAWVVMMLLSDCDVSSTLPFSAGSWFCASGNASVADSSGSSCKTKTGE